MLQANLPQLTRNLEGHLVVPRQNCVSFYGFAPLEDRNATARPSNFVAGNGCDNTRSAITDTRNRCDVAGIETSGKAGACACPAV